MVNPAPVKVLRPVAQPELLVDLHVEFGPLGLQLAAAGGRARVRALQRDGIILSNACLFYVLRAGLCCKQQETLK